MAKRNQQPRVKQAPSTKKQPKSASDPSYHHLRPSWRIYQMEMVDPFGWHEINTDTAEEIRTKLAFFESMTWGEILIDGKKQNHSAYIWQLSKVAQARLEEIQQEDVDRLVSLHLKGTERIWGILEQGVLRLLWWDPQHQVYPSKKKHT